MRATSAVRTRAFRSRQCGWLCAGSAATSAARMAPATSLPARAVTSPGNPAVVTHDHRPICGRPIEPAEPIGQTVTPEQADIQFLLSRALCAGSCSFSADRWTGLSSNAIVSVAYGGHQTETPSDRSDWAACVRTFRRLPQHRRTNAVRQAMKIAREAYLTRYPDDRYPAPRKAKRAEWHAEWQKYQRKRRRA